MVRRWVVLTALGGLGAAAFVPVMLANGARAGDAAGFVAAVTAVDAVAAGLGLRWADRVGLPMPALRALESGTRWSPPPRAARDAGLAGIGIGLASVGVLRGLDLPNLQGPLGARLLSTGFAAASLEIVVHLAVMSGIARLTGRVGWAVAGSTAAFVLFHGSGAAGMPWGVVLASLALNGAFGLAMGGLYARHGFEWVLVGHAIGHAIAVGLG